LEGEEVGEKLDERQLIRPLFARVLSSLSLSLSLARARALSVFCSQRTWIVFLLRRSLIRATPSWHCVRALEALKPKSQGTIEVRVERWFAFVPVVLSELC